MRQRLLFVAAASLVLTAACGSPMVILEIDLQQGELKTPSGKNKLYLRSDRPFRVMEPDEMGGASKRVASQIVHGGETPYEFAMLIAPSTFYASSLRVVVDDKTAQNLEIEIRDAQYTYNEGSLQPLVFSEGNLRDLGSQSYSSIVFALELPAELTAHPIREHGDGILNPEEIQSQLERERYRFTIDIRIDDVPYVMDFVLSYKIGSGTRFGVPAMP